MLKDSLSKGFRSAITVGLVSVAQAGAVCAQNNPTKPFKPQGVASDAYKKAIFCASWATAIQAYLKGMGYPSQDYIRYDRELASVRGKATDIAIKHQGFVDPTNIAEVLRVPQDFGVTSRQIADFYMFTDNTKVAVRQYEASVIMAKADHMSPKFGECLDFAK